MAVPTHPHNQQVQHAQHVQHLTQLLAIPPHIHGQPQAQKRYSLLQNELHPSIAEKLDPEFVNLYNNVLIHAPPLSSDINVVRQNYSSLYRFATNPASGVGGIGETQVPGWSKYPGDVNVRVYVPPGEEPAERKVWPVHFNFHGGGWVVGDLETDAHICHHICARVPCCVIDIEYRLIPEYPFPIGIMDALSATTHILTNHRTFSIDPDNITLGGESSGATIALVLNHLFRDAGLSSKLKGIIAATPTISDVRKYATPDMSPWPSMQESQYTPMLNWEKLKWFDTFKWMSLASSHPGTTHKEQKRDVGWFADVMNAPDCTGLAPFTFIATAEIDPLRDEAEAYAEKIREAAGSSSSSSSSRVVLKRYKGVPHGFMRLDRILRQGSEYVDDVIRHVRMCLYPPEISMPPPAVSGDGGGQGQSGSGNTTCKKRKKSKNGSVSTFASGGLVKDETISESGEQGNDQDEEGDEVDENDDDDDNMCLS